MEFLNILIFGAPGSGKGTQSKMIASHFNLFHLSTGDLLRDIRDDKSSQFYLLVKEKMSSGELVSDEIIQKIVSDKIKFIRSSLIYKGIIFDGFPRNILQAEFLAQEFEKSNITISKVFILNVDEETVINRMLNRFSCSKCGAVYNAVSKPPLFANICDVCMATNSFSDRIDDTPEVIRNRLAIFNTNMESIRDYYRDYIFEVDASGSPEEIFNNIKKHLAK